MCLKCFAFRIFIWSMCACLASTCLRWLGCMLKCHFIALHAVLLCFCLLCVGRKMFQHPMLDAVYSSIQHSALFKTSLSLHHALKSLFGCLSGLPSMICMSSTAILHLHHVSASSMHASLSKPRLSCWTLWVTASNVGRWWSQRPTPSASLKSFWCLHLISELCALIF